MMPYLSQLLHEQPWTLPWILSAFAVRPLPSPRHPQLEVAPRHQRLQCRDKSRHKSKLCVATFFWLLQLAALGDLDLFRRLVSHALGHIFDLLDDVVSFQHFPKDDMLPIQPSSDGGSDEELDSLASLQALGRTMSYLRAIGILTRIGHAQLTSLGMLQLEVLIGKLLPIDRLPTGP